jgi:hypothetical protein
MFVGFIGAPNSGKTTIAAKVFADLKQSGQPDVEFVAEEARRYIAQRIFSGNKNPLTAFDQQKIFGLQRDLEQMMVQVIGPDGILVSDSCALNSLWYMNTEDRADEIFEQDAYIKWLNKNAILFYCSPIGIMNQIDTLRLHNAKQSAAIDQIINDQLIGQNLRAHIPLHSKALTGPIDLKVSKVLEKIYERLTK